MLLLREYPRLLSQTLTGWWDIKAPRLGAALAYYTILSLAPTILIATPLIGLFFDPAAARGGIVEQFESLVGKEGARAGHADDAMPLPSSARAPVRWPISARSTWSFS